MDPTKQLNKGKHEETSTPSLNIFMDEIKIFCDIINHDRVLNL